MNARAPTPRRHARRPARRSTWALAVAALAVLAIVMLAAGGGASSRAAAPGAGEPRAQTDNSVPAPNVTIIGSSPGEAPGETWGVGQGNGAGQFHSPLVRYTSASGWTLGPAYEDAAGNPLAAFRLTSSGGGTASPLAGSMTPSGAGALVGESALEHQVLLVRDAGGVFRETAPLPAEGETALKPEEKLAAEGRAPLLAALDAGGGHAGALIVPERKSGPELSVLHWDGTAWTREPIEPPAATASDLRILAVGASSPANAWLLAQLSSSGPYPPGAVALFRRRPASGGEHARWVPVQLSAGNGDGEAHPLTAAGAPFTVPRTGEPPSVQAQVLTVTKEGVWIDGERSDVHASTTMFFKSEGEAGGHVLASWCSVSEGGGPCTHTLPEPLPAGPSRSFAWADAETPEGLGRRVITGFPEGVTLRLDGTSFTRVLGLGGSAQASPGASYGAAFSEPGEGWLGQQELPIHITRNPAPSRLTAWPVSFRRALLAVAPQPGAPVGSLASEALAVGDQGEVARYIPGRGWTPESLLSTSGGALRPRLRAVAWPTPTRAYAVGDFNEAGVPQMWLWRGETGLWEPDPATPLNFRGNLMGIAFDPTNPARGYAVGESGVLLSYGKTWTQEQSLPPEVAGATFTSIAFAGSEAIVAYRKLPDRSSEASYVGGLLVNEGSGWHVDQGAAAAIGSEVPLVVAGVPDGGAAFAAQSFSSGEGARIFERGGSGEAWQQVPTPFPGAAAPGSLALFRENGAVRVVASGTAPAGYDVEKEPASPPGFPPTLIKPYGVGSNLKSGVLRQTATGWSDEEHELNSATEPAGHYSRYDTVYQPDPVAAVLLDPTGSQGWAVGGYVDSAHPRGELDTADIERYPADGIVPTGVGLSTIPLSPKRAVFAIGGGAQCAAPCAQRAQAGVGPDVWLQAALARARQIGVRAFIDTGPRVTNGETVGPPTLALPYAEELERYGALLSSSPLPTFAAASAAELDGARAEGAAFAGVFAGFPQPLGSQGEPRPAGRSAEACTDAPGCHSAYYAFDSSGADGKVPTRVIVLDDTTDVDETQLAWLKSELTGAQAAGEPAITVGNADLGAQMAAGDSAAAAVVSALTQPAASASAYFFDAPEHNLVETLHTGGSAIPAFGSGTLGYVGFSAESKGEFTGASGFLLGEVDLSRYSAAANDNIAPVTAQLIPNVGELALEAQSGTLLRRSTAALFAGLARRPRAGNDSNPGEPVPQTSPYIPIPSICRGAACASALLPRYTFSSSRKDFGDFVTPNLALSPAGNLPLLNAQGEPIADPESGLFCAYNAGTTIVTISAGGLSASLPVTIQAGSVRRPCGTVKLTELPAPAEPVSVPNVAPSPTPSGGVSPAAALAPPIPLPPAPPLVPAAHLSAPQPAPFFFAAAPVAPLLAVVPPPVPTPARPTPPSGTSAVTQPVEAPEKEEEEEGATESVGNNAAAYRQSEHEQPPVYLLGIVLLAALAGAGIRGRPRGRQGARVAPATISSARWQRRVGRHDDDHRSHW